MTLMQRNICSEVQALAEEVLRLKARIATVSSLYVSEGIGSLTDGDFTEVPDFAHVTAAEFSQAAAAIVAVQATIGEYATGTNATKLCKVILRVP